MLKSEHQELSTVDRWIAKHVRGKTFADVGFLWGVINEKLSVASRFGATSITGIDQFSSSSPIWDEFKDRMSQRKVSYNAVTANFLDHNGPIYDVIHCSGVIYHCPDPIGLLRKLKTYAKERVILTSMITPSRIANKSGELIIPEAAAIFVPALADKEKEIVTTEWKRILGNKPGGGLTNFSNFDVSNYYDWWWLFTPTCLNAMCKACGFEIEATELLGNFYVLLLKS